MSACQEYEALLTLHASGALEPEEAARVSAHLASCAGCRREAESTARVLSGLALPPPPLALEERMKALPQRALGTWRREQVRRALQARTAAALLAAAAVVLLLVRPSLPRETPSPASVPLQEPLPGLSEAQAAFEQWASANPLGEALAGDGEEDWEEAGVEPSGSELFWTPSDGEMP